MIEDQVSPKKGGHTRGKQVISRAEARMKIRAAVDARAGADILIMARTDARAVHGFDEALARCQDFEAEGADIIFLEAPESADEMQRFCGVMNKPCLANMVPGGKTPVLAPDQLHKLGYKLALYPVMLLSSSIAAMQATLKGLWPGSKTPQPPAISFADLQGVVGFPDYWSRETLSDERMIPVFTMIDVVSAVPCSGAAAACVMAGPCPGHPRPSIHDCRRGCPRQARA